MTPEEKEGNKLIAEFMDYKLTAIPEVINPPNAEKEYWMNELKNHGIGRDDLKYHLSFDWLMPVIEKISQYEFEDRDKMYPRTFGMQDEDGNFLFRFNRSQLHYNKELITAAFEAVVEAIKFINQTKNP